MPSRDDYVWFSDLTRRALLCTWQRPDAGFLWVNARVSRDDVPDSGPWLVPQDDGGNGSFTRRYGPLGQPGLYRRFAKLNEPEAMLAFANKYGRLTASGALVQPDGGGKWVIGESFRLWQKHTRWMRFLVQVWEWVATKNVDKLFPYVWWETIPPAVWRRFVFENGELHERASMRAQTEGKSAAGHAVIVSDPKAGFWFERSRESVERDPAVLASWRNGDLIEPARDFLYREVDKQLKGGLSPRVLPLRPGDLYLQVDSLLSAIYLQFQLDIVGNTMNGEAGCKAPGCMETVTGRKRYCDECERAHRLETKKRSWHAHKNDWPSARRSRSRAASIPTPFSTPKPVDHHGR